MDRDSRSNHADTIRQLIGAMQTVAERVSSLSQETGAEAMREIVDIRRGLSNQLPQFTAACVAAIESLDATRHADMRQQLMALVNDVRSQMTTLQSHWPAVSIRQEPTEYQTARAKLDIAQTRLFDWLNSKLLPAL
jgi:uncharacterized protein YukE